MATVKTGPSFQVNNVIRCLLAGGEIFRTRQNNKDQKAIKWHFRVDVSFPKACKTAL